MSQMREFIYLDTESLNNNLSSLGKGIPSEITRANEDHTEKSGGAGGRIAGIGAEGNIASMDREQVETTLDITAPYRFQELLDEIEDSEINIKENPDPRNLTRSDLIRVEGEAYPMSILKFGLAFEAFSTFADEEFNEALRKIGESSVVSEQEMDEIESISTLLKHMSGNEYPLRIECSELTYCTKLQETNMRKSALEAFKEEEKYELFGRVKRHVPANNEWNPVYALDILEKYMPFDGMGDEFLEGIRNATEHIDISIEEEDMKVRGHTAVIEPIAMYW